jgi:hypothetical protein
MSFICKKCNYKEDLHQLELHLAASMIEYRLCQQCLQWSSLISLNKISPHQVVIIKDVCYLITKNKISNDKFVIRFRDGKQITTYNLVSFGIIPERWKKILCNNARFVK